MHQLDGGRRQQDEHDVVERRAVGTRICITQREVEVVVPEPSTSPVRLRIGDRDLGVAPVERATLTL